MKKIFAAGMFAGFIGGFFAGHIAGTIPDIELQGHSGIVTSVTQKGNAYAVRVKCECWHNGIKQSFIIFTPKNYKVGDMVKFE